MKHNQQYLWGLVFIIVMIIAGLFVLQRNNDLSSNEQTIAVVIHDRKLASPPSPIVIGQGKKVTLWILGDEDEQFHLNGYHAFVSFKAGVKTKLEFEALTPGRFPMVLDKSKSFLGEIEIH